MSRKSRGQVFVMATLLIVVYSVSIIAVVTELSVERYHEDEINLNQALSEYIDEMNFQLEKSLFKYITNSSATEDTIISDLESFVQIFTQYALFKGIQFTFEPKYDEFSLIAVKNNVAPSPIDLTNDFSQDISINLNVTVNLQSINSASSISGILTHYFGIHAFISSNNQNTLTFTQIDQNGNVLKYLSGITFTSPVTPVDEENGDYTYAPGYDGQAIYAILPSGIEFLS